MSKSSFHIMVVDDEEEIATGIAETLAALTDHTFEPFVDPYRALQAFLKRPFHLVITDISMPDIDGFELLKRMKNESPQVDAIVVTAHKNLEIVARARRLGVSYLFFKPVDLEALEEAIGSLYQKHLYWDTLLKQVDH